MQWPLIQGLDGLKGLNPSFVYILQELAQSAVYRLDLFVSQAELDKIFFKAQPDRFF